MNEKIDPPWWHGPLRALGILLGLLAMSGLLMGLIIGVARFLDTRERSDVSASAPIFISNDKPQQQNARTRVVSPYAPVEWPNRPDSPSAFGGRISRIGNGGSVIGGGSGGSNGSAPQSPPAYTGPVGVPVEEYQAAAASGKKMFIPDPKGNCDLGNTSGRDLENCFAERVAR